MYSNQSKVLFSVELSTITFHIKAWSRQRVVPFGGDPPFCYTLSVVLVKEARRRVQASPMASTRQLLRRPNVSRMASTASIIEGDELSTKLVSMQRVSAAARRE